jgi:hypothetical protein
VIIIRGVFITTTIQKKPLTVKIRVRVPRREPVSLGERRNFVERNGIPYL